MNALLSFIKLIRLPNLLFIVFTQYTIRFAVIYPFLAINSLELKLSEFHFFLLSLTTVMIAAAGYIINDYFDTKVDRVNRPETLIVGKHIKRRWAMGSHVVINGLAMMIAVYLAYVVGNFKLALIQLLSIGALWYYSTSFKKQVLIGNVLVALLAAMVPLVAGLYELMMQKNVAIDTVNVFLFSLEEGTSFDDANFVFNQILSNCWTWVLGYSFFAFLGNFAREIIKDIEDYEGDKKFNCNTLPVIHGVSKAKWAAQSVFVIMMGCLGFVQYRQLYYVDTTSFIYFFFALQFPLAYIIFKLYQAKEKSDYSLLSKYTKALMLSGVLYAFVFTYTLIKSV